jgi:hypothetical protein
MRSALGALRHVCERVGLDDKVLESAELQATPEAQGTLHPAKWRSGANYGRR